MPHRRFVVASTLAALASGAALAGPPEPADAEATRTRTVDPRMRSLLDRLPLAYEVNRGQAPEGWDFVVRCRGYHAFVSSAEVVFACDGAALRMSLDGAARVEPQTRGLELPGRVNYFLGDDPAKWVTEIPTTRGAVYRDAAPGTTWTFGGAGRALEFAFELEPGVAGPVLRFDGASATTVADDGSLRLVMPAGEARISAPVAWQDGADARIAAAAKWFVAKDGTVRIDVAARDPSRRVHVDPTVSYASYLGGSSDDKVTAAAMDGSGSAYLAGETYSSNFPTTSGAYATSLAQGASGSRNDGFVAKLNASGSALLYASYFGGSGDEVVSALEVDAAGRAHVAGWTYSTNFPVTPGAYASSNGGNGYVLALAASGAALHFSTCTARNQVKSVAVATDGGVFVCEGGELAHYSALGTRRDFGTSMSGSSSGWFNAVACDPAGDAYAVGAIVFAASWPATSGAYRGTLGGSADAFVTKVDASGNVLWTTYLGGSQRDEARYVGVNAAGQAYVAGDTDSSDFPATSGAYASSRTGSTDGFVTRIDSAGGSLRYSTYSGGVALTGIRVHPYSSWVCCGTVPPGSAVTATGGFETVSGGGYEAFVLSFHRDNSFAWSSFFGGTGTDVANGLGMAPDGSVIVVGATTSADLPMTSPYQGTQQSYLDGFALLVPDTLPTSVAALAIGESTLPGATITAAYAHAVANTGGIGPFTWSLVSGSLPPGLVVAATGDLAGVPTQSGTFAFRVRVRDVGEVVAERDVVLTVNPLPSVPGDVLGTTIGTPCDRLVPVTGGTPPFTIDLLTGTAPAGLALTANGRLTGTATALGDSALTIRAHDAYGLTATGSLTIRVNPAPSIVDATPPGATTTKEYAFTFTTAGGTAPFTWSLVSGTVPATLDAATGALGGAAGAEGTYDFVLRATDAVGAHAERAFSVEVHALPEIRTLVLRPMTVGRPFSQTLAVEGGTPPFTWAPAPGDFPTEFQVDASGRISGSPSATGSSSALVECTDRWGAVALQTVTFDAGALADLSRRKTSEKLVFESGGAGHVTRALELTEGSLLSVTLTGGRVGDEPPQLAFTDSAGVEIDLAPFTRTTKRAVAVKGLVIPATGRWFLTATVAPQFAGRVRLTIGVTPRAAWPAAATIDAGGMEDFEFSAPPGALVSVAVRAAKGSAAVPTVLHVIGPDEIDLAPAGRTSEKTGSATFSSRTPLAGGDYLVVIGARDGTAGEITWTVKLRLPRAYEFSMPDVPAGD